MFDFLKRYSGRTIFSVLFLVVLLSIFSKSILICRICAFMMALACVMLGVREKKFINPYYLFVFTPLSLVLYMDLGGLYMLDLTHKTWVLAIINIYAFMLAVYYTPSFKTYSNCVGMTNTGALSISAIVFFLLSFVGRYIPAVQSLFWFSSIAAFVCAIKAKKKNMYFFAILIVLQRIAFSNASKMDVLLFGIAFLVCYDKYFAATIKQRRKMILYSMLGGLFMIFAFSFANKNRGNYNAQDGLDYYSTYGRVEWNYSASLFLPYMYFETPWTNLQYVTETQQESTHGLWFIKPILGYVGQAENFEREYELESYSSFNTFTFITVGYKDFGYWLSVVMSLFLGWFVKKMYSRFVVSKSPFDITAYILTGLATAEMFFSNHFFMQSYPFTCLIMMEFWKFFSRMSGGQVELDYENIDEQ